MHRIINDEALDTLFRAARSPAAWLDRPVSDTLLRALWELVKLGPTAGGSQPARLLFVKSAEAKARLAAAVPPAQQGTVIAAPVTAIVGRALDCEEGSAALREGALQAASLILAARALGLDCAPIWEFDARVTEAGFFPDGAVATAFLCVFGYGDDAQLPPPHPRPAFDEACRIL
jgi:3-hydroxypropanoate dehydrogenase